MNKNELITSLRYTDSDLKSVLSNRKPATALVADLSEKESYTYDIPQAFLEKYSGGPALGARLWAEFAGYSVDDPSCLETENPIVIVPSFLGTSKMPYGDLASIVFRSPVTETLSFNNFRSSLSVSPYAAIIITGRLDKKGVIRFGEDGFVFEDAQNLIDKDTSEISLLYKNAIICGRAGDNKVLISTCVCNGASTGRGGLGFVFASKNLKAVTLAEVQKEDMFEYGKLLRRIASSPAYKNTDSYTVRIANDNGWAPVNNFTRRYDPRLFYLSSNRLSEPIPYEVRLMLGCNCGTFDIKKVQKRYDFCIENGLDPISAGNIMGCNSIADQNQVMAFLSLLVKQSGFGKQADYCINGLECGPYDYRGTFAQALSDSLGNNFPVYFSFGDDYSPKCCAKLVSFNERLVMGLQSLGVNHEILYPLLETASGFRHFPGVFTFAHLLAFSIKNACKSDMSFRTILKIGENGRTLIRNINSILKQTKVAIPDYFTIEPKSNHPSDSVVPFRQMLVHYKKQKL